MNERITLDECIKYFEADAAENKKLYLIYKTYDEEMAAMHKEDAERSAMVSAFKQKWFKTSREERLKKYIDGSLDNMRRDLYKLIGEVNADE